MPPYIKNSEKGTIWPEWNRSPQFKTIVLPNLTYGLSVYGAYKRDLKTVQDVLKQMLQAALYFSSTEYQGYHAYAGNYLVELVP